MSALLGYWYGSKTGFSKGYLVGSDMKTLLESGELGAASVSFDGDAFIKDSLSSVETPTGFHAFVNSINGNMLTLGFLDPQNKEIFEIVLGQNIKLTKRVMGGKESPAIVADIKAGSLVEIYFPKGKPQVSENIIGISLIVSKI